MLRKIFGEFMQFFPKYLHPVLNSNQIWLAFASYILIQIQLGILTYTQKESRCLWIYLPLCQVWKILDFGKLVFCIFRIWTIEYLEKNWLIWKSKWVGPLGTVLAQRRFELAHGPPGGQFPSMPHAHRRHNRPCAPPYRCRLAPTVFSAPTTCAGLILQGVNEKGEYSHFPSLLKQSSLCSSRTLFYAPRRLSSLPKCRSPLSLCTSGSPSSRAAPRAEPLRHEEGPKPPSAVHSSTMRPPSHRQPLLVPVELRQHSHGLCPSSKVLNNPFDSPPDPVSTL
jgi:hypothetical protein